MSKGFVVALVLACPSKSVGGCAGTDVLQTLTAVPARARGARARVQTLGSARFSIPAGRRATIRLKLGHEGRKLLLRARHHTLRAREVVASHDAAGRRAREQRIITLHR